MEGCWHRLFMAVTVVVLVAMAVTAHTAVLEAIQEDSTHMAATEDGMARADLEDQGQDPGNLSHDGPTWRNETGIELTCPPL